MVKQIELRDPKDLERRDAIIGILAFALAIVVIIVAVASYNGWSPQEYTIITRILEATRRPGGPKVAQKDMTRRPIGPCQLVSFESRPTVWAASGTNRRNERALPRGQSGTGADEAAGLAAESPGS